LAQKTQIVKKKKLDFIGHDCYNKKIEEFYRAALDTVLALYLNKGTEVWVGCDVGTLELVFRNGE
jgi:hypothetical protein